MKPAGGMWGNQRVWGAGSGGCPQPEKQPARQVWVPLEEDTSAPYLTTCLVKFNGLVIPGK